MLNLPKFELDVIQPEPYKIGLCTLDHSRRHVESDDPSRPTHPSGREEHVYSPSRTQIKNRVTLSYCPERCWVTTSIRHRENGLREPSQLFRSVASILQLRILRRTTATPLCNNRVSNCHPVLNEPLPRKHYLQSSH